MVSKVTYAGHRQIPEPPVPGYGEDFGKLAVEVFFCLSGFLTAGPFKSQQIGLSLSPQDSYAFSPNLAFSLTVTSKATLLWYRNYIHLWKHAKFVIGNLLIFFRGVTHTIPGVFQDAKGAPAINGPLWRLPYEV
jgi:hypothetical protein